MTEDPVNSGSAPPVKLEDIENRYFRITDRRASHEDRRAKRNLKHWLVKLVAFTFMIVVVASVLSLIYAAINQEKDLDTAFIGELFKNLINFITFLLT